MIKLKVTGGRAVVVELRNIAQRVTNAARLRMHRGAAKVVKEGQLNAPRDTYRLEESIHIEKTYGTRGRLQIDIVAGGIVDGVNVDDYAALMHEHYEEIISSDPTDEQGRARREGTIQKQAENPSRYIGGKYLERALEDTGKTLPGEIENDIDDAIGKAGKRGRS